MEERPVLPQTGETPTNPQVEGTGQTEKLGQREVAGHPAWG